MTNRFDEADQLKVLTGRRDAIIEREQNPCSPNYAILERIKIERDLLEAARWLTEVARCFQKGDAHELDVMSTFFSIPREGMTTTSYQKWLQWALVLTRLQKAAEIMEGNE